ncbi:MAG: hypothetical protein AAFP87_03110 [Pseudomonadota bacterium]
MDMLLASDLMRIAHLFAVILAMGAAFFADWRMFGGIHRPIAPRELGLFDDLHRFVVGTLALVWITGLALIWLRTGFQLSEFSPKLFSKLIVVTVLTLNATAIGAFALPLMRTRMGAVPLHFSLSQKLTLGTVAAVSTASWLLALSLGGSKVLAASGWDILVPLLAGAYSGAILLAGAGAIASHAALSIGAANDPFQRLKNA